MKIGLNKSYSPEGPVWNRRKGKKMDDHHDSQFHVKSSNFSDTNNMKKKKKVGFDDEKSCRNKKKQFGLVSFRELPEYMKDNEFILNYYRANWPLKQAFFSVFCWHNETLNVWTHLLGFILFLGLTVANLMQVPQVADFFGLITRSIFLSSQTNGSDNFRDFIVGTTKLIKLQQINPDQEMYIPSSSADRWPFFVFLGGSMFCLLSSSICHLFSCHSHPLNILLLRIDYVGITTMIITSFFPPIYYIFLCEPHFQILYLSAITLMGIFTIFSLLSPAVSSSKYRSFRALLFCSMGLFGIFPAVHSVIVNWNNPKRNVTLAYESAMAVFYLTGAGFYVSRVPERWRPGWFDLAGHSHQLFHILVVLGALSHYGASLVMLEWRENFGCAQRLR